MEPLVNLLVLGVLGGLVLSWLIARHRRGTPPTFVPSRLDPPTPALINMAHIRVEGIGGLGMVAAVIAVAIADSRIATRRCWTSGVTGAKRPAGGSIMSDVRRPVGRTETKTPS